MAHAAVWLSSVSVHLRRHKTKVRRCSFLESSGWLRFECTSGRSIELCGHYTSRRPDPGRRSTERSGPV